MLTKWIREVAHEPLLIDPTARDAEQRENTWRLSRSVDDPASLSARDVVAAFEECAAVLRARIKSLGYGGSATFYVWHDEQAGQLRCSTTTWPREQLPFGAEVELNVTLEEIVQGFLDDTNPGQLVREGFEEVSDNDSEELQAADVTLCVWTAEVGGAQ